MLSICDIVIEISVNESPLTGHVLITNVAKNSDYLVTCRLNSPLEYMSWTREHQSSSTEIIWSSKMHSLMNH